ncbi:complex I subunit 5 family protein [Anoxynatronum buryatiense]|uniref:Formate hydrogenlyase subunit 3/Multisubunit Na+/H+ antiporter, MnhD subunit n=1 Tax=Anoxynatronum buryatiense TaxID=489973 RepID=A0AA45WTX8_9CLOT|nr:proton-conducting transporter membrane subunit [Anoxynatronum buryatiense]SMP45145.1 Formate hydrogenlyase subunit 3/Multisubunit Na+/H+ antiporter, MnhD subunit [Anoxynatronum buryatiense]
MVSEETGRQSHVGKPLNKWYHRIMNYFCISCIIMFAITLLLVAAFIVMVLGRTAEGINPNLPGFLTGMVKLLEPLAAYPYLPLLTIFVPLLGGPVEAFIGKRSENFRDFTVVFSTFGTFVLILAMYPQVAEGGIINTIPGVFGYGLHFRVDMLSYIMVSTAGILWLMVSIYAHEYMGMEQHRDRFYLFMSITFGGVLGTVMAADILTMFLFFELMTFSSYLLVAHNQSPDSILAGNNYIYMGVGGGLSVLIGMILLLFNTNHLDFVFLATELNELGWLQYAISGLFIIGFGIKAGMLPLHIWLPKAHPVAPTPASALLSGLLIKIGAYGLLRMSTSFFMPAAELISDKTDPLWSLSKNMGVVIIWIGIITMAVGVFMALQQGNMKKMLAYHSISQMGYIVMGIGVASYLGYIGAMGFAGSIYHTINHAFFKALLFMVVGVIYLRTHELDMYKLGGLWRQMPFTALVCLIAALGITGMPGFNGFASKSILHHAIVEAYEYGHSSFRYAEIIFTIVSGGTVCSFIKLFSYAFLGKCPEKYQQLPKEGNGMMQMAMGGLALLIIGIGMAPGFIMDQLIIPAASGFTYDAYFINKYLVGMNFFNAKDMMGMVPVYLLGIGIFVAGRQFDLFHLHMPKWMDFELILYRPIYQNVLRLSRGITAHYEMRTNNADVYIYALILVTSLFFLAGYFR